MGGGGVGLHLAGLGFATVQSFWYTNGQQVAPSPWFIQPVYPAVVCLVVSGLAASGRVGKGIGIAAIWLWSYVICATYWLKLIPLYAGYPSPQAQPAKLFRWYTQEFPAALDTTALIGSRTVLVLTIAVTLTTLGLAGWLSARITALVRRQRPEVQLAAGKAVFDGQALRIDRRFQEGSSEERPGVVVQRWPSTRGGWP